MAFFSRYGARNIFTNMDDYSVDGDRNTTIEYNNQEVNKSGFVINNLLGRQDIMYGDDNNEVGNWYDDENENIPDELEDELSDLECVVCASSILDGKHNLGQGFICTKCVQKKICTFNQESFLPRRGFHINDTIIKLPLQLRTNPAFFCCNFDLATLERRPCSIKEGLLKFFRYNAMESVNNGHMTLQCPNNPSHLLMSLSKQPTNNILRDRSIEYLPEWWNNNKGFFMGKNLFCTGCNKSVTIIRNKLYNPIYIHDVFKHRHPQDRNWPSRSKYRFKMSKIPCPRCGLWNEKWDDSCNHIKCGGEQGTPCDNPRNTNSTDYCAVCGREYEAHPSNSTYNYDGTTIDDRMVRDGGHQTHFCTQNDRGERRINYQKDGQFYKLLVAYKQLLEWDNADEQTRIASGYPQDENINANFSYDNYPEERQWKEHIYRFFEDKQIVFTIENGYVTPESFNAGRERLIQIYNRGHYQLPNGQRRNIPRGCWIVNNSYRNIYILDDTAEYRDENPNYIQPYLPTQTDRNGRLLYRPYGGGNIRNQRARVPDILANRRANQRGCQRPDRYCRRTGTSCRSTATRRPRNDDRYCVCEYNGRCRSVNDQYYRLAGR